MAQMHSVRFGPEASGKRLDRALADALPTLSRERIKALISTGALTLDGGLARDPAIKLKGGEAASLSVPDAAPAEAPAQAIPLTILFEDDHLLVVDKPAGLVVHPAAGNPDGTLVNALLHHCQGRLSGIGGVARPGIVHRIDKDTSGLLVVAKTERTHEGLARQFAAHTVERIYTAVVVGRPPQQGTIEGAIGRSAADRKKMAIVDDDHGKPAITHYRVTSILDGAAVLACQLETGRTHQIRVHLASIGHALLGDPSYGRASRSGPVRQVLADLQFRRQALHAGVLGFRHPITKADLRFESALPGDMDALIAALALTPTRP
jgi:23S rRNA pseudouridine1911/1915/1917 synthase